MAHAADASESRALFFSREEAEEACEKYGWYMVALAPVPIDADEAGKAELLACSSMSIDDNYRCVFRLERREGQHHPPNELVHGFLKAADAFMDSMREELRDVRVKCGIPRAAPVRGLLEEHKGEKNLNDAEPEKMESIEIEVDKELLHKIMILAHEANVTLNKYIEVLLTDYLDELEREEAG
jgi:hypothetical protein